MTDRLSPDSPHAVAAVEYNPHDEANDSGGLIDIKSLLRHLENFRWLLVKSFFALLIGMVLCLLGGHYLVTFLRWPLRTTAADLMDTKSVWIQLGPEQFQRLPAATNSAGARLLPLEPGTVLRLAALPVGDRLVLGLHGVPVSAGNFPRIERVRLNAYGPAGAFAAAFQIALYGGAILASPFIFFFLGQFISPMLDNHPEVRKTLGRWMTVGAILFLSGILFCYLLLLRVSLYGSVGFSQWMRFSADEWSGVNYVGFVCKFMLGMGVGFELPVLLLLLVRVGVLSVQKLVRFRVYWVVLNLVASAFITPDGSPITMILMAAPLWGLYEISILIARRWEKSPISTRT